jgi:phosphopantothenoylcysteine decarboxylase/phosphopantothenate--cysteine ligase
LWLKIKNRDNFGLNSRRQRYFSFIRKDKEKSVLIGFALETENEIENAKVKSEKNLDLIVLNSLQMTVQVLEITNKVTFISKFNIEPMELKSKEAVADDILNKVIANFYE